MKIEEYDFYSDEFTNQLQQRIDIIKNEYHDIPIRLSSNAFVDAGIYATAILQEKEITHIQIGDLLDTILNIDGENSWGNNFALRNFRTKTVSKVLFNNPLNQAAYGSTKKEGIKKSPAKSQPSPLQQRLYIAYLVEFLINYGQDKKLENHDDSSQCIFCGEYTQLDFNTLETTFKVLAGQKPLNKADDFGSGPTRTWIPLLGTTSSIQSLPGFAEPNVVCGKCLTLTQFLPQVVDLQNGLVTVYQSNNHDLVKEFYKINLETFQTRHQTIPLDDKLEIVGSDAWDYYINNLLKIIRENQSSLLHSDLILWRFDNYGTDPSLKYVKLPNTTLLFLHTVIKEYGAENTIRQFIRFEEENNIYSSMQLFNSIESKQDYFLFYPHTKYEVDTLFTQEFFELYQNYIRDWDVRSIITARTIAKSIKSEEEDIDELLRLLKERDGYNLRNFLVPRILNQVENGTIELDDIIHLLEVNSTEVENRDPWKFFQYYLHPKVTIIDNESLQESNNSHYNKNRLRALAIIQLVAQLNTELAEQRSSFDQAKYLDQLSRYRFNDFRNAFVRAGLNDTRLTWDRSEYIQSQLYRNEILLYYRLFSITTSNNINIELETPIISDIRNKAGLHSNLIQILEEYIEMRIEEIGSSRIFRELEQDLYYKNYSARQFFNILLRTKNDQNIDIPFSEYHYFGYELDQLETFKTKSSNKANPKFSWSRMRDKLRLFIFQYKTIRKPNLEQQLEETL